MESIEIPTQPTAYGINAQVENENPKGVDANVSAGQHGSPNNPMRSTLATGYESDPRDANPHLNNYPSRMNTASGPRLNPETGEHLSNPNPEVPRTPAHDTGEPSNTGKDTGGYLSLLYRFVL